MGTTQQLVIVCDDAYAENRHSATEIMLRRVLTLYLLIYINTELERSPGNRPVQIRL